MRPTSALLWLLLLAAAVPVQAQNPIHHCIGAHGNPVFTDQPCASLDATPVGAAPPSARDDSGPPDAPPPLLCAATTAQLRQSVIDAFAQRDANRMAGLMLWGGYGQGAAVADIRSLALLMRRPLLDLQLTGSATTDPPPAGAASSGAAPAADAATAGPQLRLQLAGTDASGSPRELRFDIVQRAGCLWLRNAE
jgi:hypothetical protein